jgi:hypothetical protein
MRTAAAVRAVRDVDERARGVAVEQRVEEPQRPVCVRARARGVSVCACVGLCAPVCVRVRVRVRSYVRV